MTNQSKPRQQTKGKKLGWEIIKLQAQVGETTSRKAKKAVEAERKKEGVIATTTTGEADTQPTSEEAEESSKAVNEAAQQKLQELKAIKISQKIYHAKKEIKKAFVKAKSFETQRLVKRLREARKSVENGGEKMETKEEAVQDKPAGKKKHELTADDVTRFENELELVKKMDMESLSEHSFVAKLAKHPILGTHALLEPYVKVKTEKKKENTSESADRSSQGALLQIIEARLTNTKTVKEHLAKLWDEVERIVTGKKVDHQELKNKKRKGGNQEENEEIKGQMNKKAKTTKDTRSKIQETSDSEGDDELELADMSDISDSENDDGYDSDGLPLSGNNGRPSSAASSMFIGSLNASHSKDKKDKKRKKDKNDWVDDKFDEIYGKVKKNRPGQRARRQKAERKFGKDANHIKKAEEEARLREEKKAARKAKQERLNAKNSASTANAQRLPNRRTIGAGDGSASVQNPVSKKTPSGPDLNDPTLHPSWIAKQTEKAAMAAALSGAKSNKIVFADTD
ncbi:hypothetical protein BGX28_001384 [Mortierella sp. GBA30]|nr:hypothetical protein BGX28_001384 [Mortierella sp. GBA30]